MFFRPALLLVTVFFHASCVTSNHDDISHRSSQQPLLNTNGALKRVAVIGAGPAGSSAAYYLHEYASKAGVQINITVLERSSYVGGRSTTVNVYDDPSEPVELGASIFVEANRNLVSAARAFNLSTSSSGLPTRHGNERKNIRNVLGIWNGKEFVFTQPLEVTGWRSWWSTARLFYRYGLAPVKTVKLMKDVTGKFFKMYDPPYFPWNSLSEVVEEVGLMDATSVSGDDFLEVNGIGKGGGLFGREVVQASTRVNYAQNLRLIHGLETMVCLATDGAMAVDGGNWQIFDNMLRAADVDVRLNTHVAAIMRLENGLYNVRSKDSFINASTMPPEAREYEETYDTVILAAQYQHAGIRMEPELEQNPDYIPFVQLHVTLFSSPHLLSPAAFGLAPTASVPQVILTTLQPDEHPGKNPQGVGKAGFFSISTLRSIINHNVQPQREEFIYKIFSPERINAAFLGHILGLREPSAAASVETLTIVDTANSVSGNREEEEISLDDVSWIYRKVWNSYPYLYPRATFESNRLDHDLWYTSGMESFISTMETSSLSGMNVARLIVDEWVENN